MTDHPVHLIKNVSGSDKKILVKCGQELPHRSHDPLPPTTTAWWSKVSCPDCLKEMDRGC